MPRFQSALFAARHGLAFRVLRMIKGQEAMMDRKHRRCTTLLLVDDNSEQLELRAVVLQNSGFSVITATNPLEALAMMTRPPVCRVDIAVLDYEMPAMNGCVLAEYLRAGDSRIRIVLHSGASHIPENEIRNVDVFVAKGDGVARLVEEIGTLAHC